MRGSLLGFVVLSAAACAQPAVTGRAFRLEELKTPPGFEVSVWARVSGGPRHMAVGPNGVLYVAARSGGTVVALPARDQPVTVLRNLDGPHSLEFRGSELWVATNNAVLRYSDAVPEGLVIHSTPQRVVSLPEGGGHSTRTLGFGPDGRLFVTAGSTCNFCVEPDERRAAMMRFEADGSGQVIFARGLRNSVDFAWHPVTGELWSVDNGGDGLGDQRPPEEINILKEGGDYGWPDCYADRVAVSWGAGARTGRCPSTLGPEFELPAHAAPLGIAFYTGDQFPAAWRNDALVALHGSWNRNDPSGYKVVRVLASTGRATGVDDFLWGFFDPATRTRSARPVQAITGPDGAVYVSDDAGGYIFRVSYTGPRIAPGGIVDRGDRYVEIYGWNLATDSSAPSVQANDAPAEVLYASPGQVNARLPEGLAGDTRIRLARGELADSAMLPGGSLDR